MKARLTILGCGNSSGVPAIGNYWGDCDPDEPKNLRTRSSIAVQTENTSIVVDTGPDFRAQMNRENIRSLDAAFFTHTHSDHVHGIDDLRGFYFRNGRTSVPVYGSDETLSLLDQRFHYAFRGGDHELYPQILEMQAFRADDYGRAHVIGDLEFVPFQMDHGSCMATGFRFGNAAYCVDFFNLDEAAIEVLQGVDIWIADCAGYKDTQNKVHANFETLFRLNERIQASQVYLSSLSLLMDYRTLVAELPEGYMPAYDGLQLEIDV